MPWFKRKAEFKSVKVEEPEKDAQKTPAPSPTPQPPNQLTEEEQELLDEWRQKWSQTLRENFALGIVGRTVAVPYKGEMLLFYNLQTISENHGPNIVEKCFIGIAEDLTLKEVYVKFVATPQGVSTESEIKPANYKALGISPEAVAKLIQQVIKCEVT